MARKKTTAQEKYLAQFNNGIVRFFAYWLRYKTKEFMAVIIMLLLSAIIILTKEDLRQLPFVKKLFSTETKAK